VKAILATFLRELRAYFFSPLAYVVLFFFLAINGIAFWFLISLLNDPRAPAGPPMAYFLGGTFLFWIVVLLVAPALTMRLISEELRSGSVEVLMTAPITEGQVVVGKFLAALAFFAFLWLPTLAYAGIIEAYGEVDWGPVASGYLGLFCIGALFLAVGLFASALTRSQLVAVIITVALLLTLFMTGFLGELFRGDAAREAFGYLNLANHMDELARGIVDTRRLVYYLSTTVFFLFLAARALEDRKWR
jgi:ABC-2 type transport system permease protein